jgi:hypothetical protein
MYSCRNHLSLAISALILSLPLSSSSFANEAFAEKNYEDAVSLFAQRSATDPNPIEEVLSVLGKLENKSDDADVNYDVYVLKARALYWKGTHAATDKEKMAIHELGQNAAEAAKKMNDGYADAYYYAGINLARWGEANGVVQSLFKKDQLMKYMNDAMDRPARDGQAGESVDGYGPDRTLGRIYFKLPAIFGGSHSKSVNYLKKAVEDQTYPVALNVVYYAETLMAGSTTEKALAKQILDELIAQDPATVNPDRVPENLDELELAKQLRAKIR